MKELTITKIIVILILSIYTLYKHYSIISTHFNPILYLTIYTIDLLLSICSHFKITSKFFKLFKTYNDDTTVIEFHFLVMNISLILMSFNTFSYISFHMFCLLIIFILNLFILLNIDLTQFKLFKTFRIPFTYCEFFVHSTIILIFIFIKRPQLYFTFSMLITFFIDHYIVIFLWILLLTIMIIVSIIPHKPQYVSVQRKSFHFVAACIYAIGIHTDTELLGIGSNWLVILFILFDFLRAKLFPNGFISKLFTSYKDSHQDPQLSCGFPAFLLLYINTIPLIFNKTQFHSAIISTIMTVDVGDAFAAIIGSYFGKKYPIIKCGKKTLLGTLAYILSCFIVGILLMIFIPMDISLIQLLSISITTGLFELTCENDNLILPFFSLLFI